MHTWLLGKEWQWLHLHLSEKFRDFLPEVLAKKVWKRFYVQSFFLWETSWHVFSPSWEQLKKKKKADTEEKCSVDRRPGAECDLWPDVIRVVLSMRGCREPNSNSNRCPPSTFKSQEAACNFIGSVPPTHFFSSDLDISKNVELFLKVLFLNPRPPTHPLFPWLVLYINVAA